MTVFDAELIPEGDVIDIDDEMITSMTEDEIEKIVFINSYAIEMVDIA